MQLLSPDRLRGLISAEVVSKALRESDHLGCRQGKAIDMCDHLEQSGRQLRVRSRRHGSHDVWVRRVFFSFFLDFLPKGASQILKACFMGDGEHALIPPR